MMTKYFLKFDDHVEKYEHNFHHFMWGYLLPALYEIYNIKIMDNGKSEYFFYLSSANPVMDNITNNLVSILGINYSIVNIVELNSTKDLTIIKVPRWDHMLYEVLKEKKKVGYQSYFQKFISFKWILDPSIIKRKLKQIHSKFLGGETQSFTKSILSIRSFILGAIENYSLDCDTKTYQDKYLILKRSPQTKYHKTINKTYGINRRALTGIEEAKKYLQNENMLVEIFEPGKYSITEQIKIFNTCKGIIGIRGAEFANIIWMSPGSKIILIQVPSLLSPNISRVLAPILSIDYNEIITDVPHYPKLDPKLLINFLN